MEFNGRRTVKEDLEGRLEGVQVIVSPPFYSPNYDSPADNLTEIKADVTYQSGGYRNKSRLANLPPQVHFSWEQFLGAYGAIGAESDGISVNPVLRGNIEELQRTVGHEYCLHGKLGKMWNLDDRFPGGRYPIDVLENWIFCTDLKEKLRYKN